MMEEKATDKQINFATKLGIPTPDKFSKRALKELISTALETQGDKVETVKIEAPVSKPKSGFHLTPEQVRCNAINSAIETFKSEKMKFDWNAVISMAEEYEKWVLR